MDRETPSGFVARNLHKWKVQKVIEELREKYQLPDGWVEAALVNQIDCWPELLRLLNSKMFDENEHTFHVNRGLRGDSPSKTIRKRRPISSRPSN